MARVLCTNTIGRAAINRRELLRNAAAGLAVPALALLAGEDSAQAAASDEAILGPLIEGAKREGAVIAAGQSLQNDECKKVLAGAFRKRYGLPSSFHVELILRNTGPVQKQTEEEIAAGKVVTDVIYINVIAWADSLAKRGKLMAFDAPEYRAYSKHDDKPGFNNRPYYVSDMNILGPVVWNTDMIKGNKFESWFDVLRPEYKGKLSILSARIASSWALTYKGMREAPAIGDRFFRELAKLEPVTMELSEALVQKTVSGEYPISIGGSTRAFAAWKNGARNIAQSFPKEGVVPLPNPWFGLAGAPHPNAAKLLLNFARSREAQQIMADYEGRTSGRSDMPPSESPFLPNLNDLNLLFFNQVAVSPQEFRTLGEDWRNMFGM